MLFSILIRIHLELQLTISDLAGGPSRKMKFSAVSEIWGVVQIKAKVQLYGHLYCGYGRQVPISRPSVARGEPREVAPPAFGRRRPISRTPHT
jgi:hypothetical protein